ncbi:hypothetical protein FRC09_001812 [Ceratobasidium sp. 395]|nr:hypothetical protein FRC09_001812 [Ceratobasidium sp. 395]
MRFSYVSALTIIGGSLAAPALMVPRQSNSTSPHVLFCDQIYWGPPCMIVGVPMDTCILMPSGWLNMISSFQPSNGTACRLYPNTGCRGQSMCAGLTYPGSSDLRTQDFNDKLGSFKCRKL